MRTETAPRRRRQDTFRQLLRRFRRCLRQNRTMSDNMNKYFDQVVAFQKLWADSLVNMAGVWSQFSPGSPPFAEMGKMRGGMLKLLAETFDEYMRTLHGALDLKRGPRDGMNIKEPGLDIYKVGTVEAPPGGA